MSMSRSKWMHMGTVLKMNAINCPNNLGWQDTTREFTFEQWNERANRFACGLQDLGVSFKDTFAVISYNRGEWMDIYAGCAKGGQVVVPIMFRLAGPEIEYIVNHAECKGFIVEAPFADLINSIRGRLRVPKRCLHLSRGRAAPEGYIGFEELLAKSSPKEPDRLVYGDDVWNIMYTSVPPAGPKASCGPMKAIWPIIC